MKVRLFGKDLEEVRLALARLNFEEVERQPEVIISRGGDGTLLAAERQFPGIPKLPLRPPGLHRKCPQHQDEKMLEALKEGKVRQTVVPKLNLSFQVELKQALNEVTLTHQQVTTAVRFQLWIDKSKLGDEPLIGDGLIIATTFGSTGYFASVSRMVFSQGIGIALNNVVNLPLYQGIPVSTMVVDQGAKITVEIRRGPALLTVDNDPQVVKVDEGDRFQVESSDHQAVLLGLDAFRCVRCR